MPNPTEVHLLHFAGKKAADEADAMKRIACVAARAGVLEPRAADRIGRRVLRQVLSSEPLTARHAMALAVEVARKVHHTVSALSAQLYAQLLTFIHFKARSVNSVVQSKGI